MSNKPVTVTLSHKLAAPCNQYCRTSTSDQHMDAEVP
jgi:hypothetical protein